MATNLSSSSLPEVMQEKLSSIRQQEMWIRVQTGLMVSGAIFLGLLICSLSLDWTFTLFEYTPRLLLSLTVLSITLLFVVSKALTPILFKKPINKIATTIDQAVPDLEERWSTIMNLSDKIDDSEWPGSKEMLNQVRTEATAQEHLVSPEVVLDRRQLFFWNKVVIGFGLVLLLMLLFSPWKTFVLLQRFCFPMSDISLVQLHVEQGNMTVPRGESLNLVATISSDEVRSGLLFLRQNGASEEHEIKVSEGESPQIFHRIKSVDEPFEFRFRAGDGQTSWYKVDIAERPTFKKIHFTLTPPAYTKLPQEKQDQLPSRLRAVKGSRLSVRFKVSQPLTDMSLVMGKNKSLTLQPITPQTYLFELELQKSITFSPKLTNSFGLHNRKPPSCRITVYEDRAPAISLITPEDELAVPGDDMIDIEFMAKDDFAVTKAELVLYKETTDDLSAEPEEFKVIDIPLGDEAGERHLTKLVQLDLKELNLPDKSVLSYAVRVFDSKENSSTPRSNKDWQPSHSQQSQPQNKENSQQSNQSNSSQSQSNSKSKTQDQSSDDQSKNTSSENEQADQEKQERGQENSSASKEPQPNSENNQASQGSQSKSSSQQQTEGENSSQSNSNNLSNTAKKPLQKNKDQQDRRQILIGEEKPNTKAENSEVKSPASESSAQQGPSSSSKSNRPPEAAEPNENQQAPLPTSPSKNNNQAPIEEPNRDGPQGAPRPKDEMQRRTLDVETQSSTSSKKRLVIDEWAGRFDGQRRKKYQMAIDPVLKQLRKYLTEAARNSKQYVGTLSTTKSSTNTVPTTYKITLKNLKQSLLAINDLQSQSSNTPYAFIGLQVADIRQAHIQPADELWSSLLQSDEKVSVGKQTIFHLDRALKRLADLTKKYEDVKRNEKLAEKMERLKKMYQVFIEDSFTMLGSAKPRKHDKTGKMLEFEFDDEVLRKIEEVMRKRQELYAEFAKILAEDPRLLKRYMENNQSKSTILREKLSELNVQQQSLLQESLTWRKHLTAKANKKDDDKEEEQSLPKLTTERFKHQTYELVDAAGRIHDKLVTWLPTDLGQSQAKVKEATAVASTLAAETGEFAQAKGKERITKAEQLIEKYKKLSEQLLEIPNKDQFELTEHITRRTGQVKELMIDFATWIEKAKKMEANDFLGAAEIDQYDLLDELYVFVGQFQSVETQLESYPVDIRKKGLELKQKLQIDVASEITKSESALAKDNLNLSLKHQRQAVNEFNKAEKLFDEMLERMLEEMNKVPPGEVNPDDIQFNLTLEDLLALLEQEGLENERTMLAILKRPANLRLNFDWMKPSSGGGGGGGISSAMMMTGKLNQLQQELLKKAKAEGITSGKQRKKWNSLISTLEEGMKQNRGKLTPEQYRRAIDQYFEALAKEIAEEQQP